MKIRQAKLEDFEQVHELTAYSYGFDSIASKESRMKQWELTFDEQFLSEKDGEITANTRMIPFEQNIRNSWMKMGGIAMVATDPIHRRKGHVKEIMKFLIQKMAKEKYDISTLYPFNDAFYSKFGYTNISANVSLKINPKHFARWKKLPEGYTIKRLNHQEGFEILRNLHTKVVSKIHGAVKRTEKRWKEYDRPSPASYVVTFNSKGEPEGILRGMPKGFMTGFDWSEDGVLNVSDFYYLSTNAKHALFTFIYLNGDQIVEVKLPVLPGESELYPWLQDYYLTGIDSQNIWQARVINVKSTIEKLNSDFEGNIKIKVIDDLIESNNQTFELRNSKNKFSVKKIDSSDKVIELSIYGLTSLIYGVLNSNEIEQFEWLQNASDKDKKLLDSWFPRNTPYITEGF